MSKYPYGNNRSGGVFRPSESTAKWDDMKGRLGADSFRDLVNSSREKQGLKPLEFKDKQENKKKPPEVKTSVKVLSQVPAVIPSPDLPPMPATLEHANWQNVMETMAKLECVFEWACDKQPTILEALSIAEDECLRSAKSGNTKEYNRLRSEYLKGIGELCETYFKRLFVSVDAFAMKYDFKRVRFHAVKPSKPSDDGYIDFYANEFPTLVLSTPHEMIQILAIKEGIPGSYVSYDKL